MNLLEEKDDDSKIKRKILFTIGGVTVDNNTGAPVEASQNVNEYSSQLMANTDDSNSIVTYNNTTINSDKNDKEGSITNNSLYNNNDSDNTLRSKKSKFRHQKIQNEYIRSEDVCYADTLPHIETYPDISNYRNLLSIGGTAKPRPTLFELQNFDRYSIQQNNDQKLENFSEGCELILNNTSTTNNDNNKLENTVNKPTVTIVKFGWIQGVLIRCILNIFGVMIFLRLSWVVGQAGLGLATLIILIATIVTFITALSASAICTNGEVKGGGAYYLISRSLGPEFGGAIGLVFSFANAVAAAMYIVGFSETVFELMMRYGLKLIDKQNDIRIIGLITLIILTAIALIGMKWESKVQIGLLIILMISFLNFVIGTFIPPTDEKKAKGFMGYKLSIMAVNFLPDFQNKEDFAHVFGVFFPAVTGILAGANISGNLKNPQKAIPKGTLLSVVITSFIYLLFAWICGMTVLREATGNIEDLRNGSSSNCTERSCNYGLLHNYQTMEMVSVYGPIVTAGIFSASLSSALASLVSAPKIFEAVCMDRIFPKFEFFAVSYGRNQEPFRAYFLTFIIAIACIAIGDLNQIAPIISNFFLMSYALINYSCFDASIAKTPGWRPAFKYYNKWVSLFGALLCLSVMFVIKWWAALVTFVVIAGIYLYVRQRKPGINWGSSAQAHIYRRSLEYSLKLISIEEHVKNFRPQCLVLTGQPMTRPVLCDFTAAITKKISLMVCANVILDKERFEQPSSTDIAYNWLRKKRMKAFYTEIKSNSLRNGILALMQCVGIGKLRPNTLVIGFKNDWKTASTSSVLEYFQIINDAFFMQYSICILRISGGLKHGISSNDLNENISTETDDSDNERSERTQNVFEENDSNINNNKNNQNNRKLLENGVFRKIKERFFADKVTIENKSGKNDNNVYDNDENMTNDNININSNNNSRINDDHNDNNQIEKGIYTSSPKKPHVMTKIDIDNNNDENLQSDIKENPSFISAKSIQLSNIKSGTESVMQNAHIFQRNRKKDYIDVWWLYDDGGLTILIPYLLSQRKLWQNCKLRIFIQSKKNANDSLLEQRNMAALLTKFRIKFDEIIVINTFNVKPQKENIEFYEALIKNWRLKPNETSEECDWKLADSVIEQNQEKINHYVRLRELLLEHSSLSALIIITITVPSKLTTPAALYISWLDLISDGLPPVLMVRGNQTPVITYYS